MGDALGVADWVRSIFGHPPTATPWWRGNAVARPLDPHEAPIEALGLVTELLERPHVLDAYTDEQVARGLWFVFDTSCSDYTMVFRWRHADWNLRQKAFRAITILYRECLAMRCADVMGHPMAAALNTTCYMLLDLSEAFEPRPEEDPAGDSAFLAVAEEVLRISHVACQDSALHALGHWASVYPARVASIVDEYLSINRAMPTELREYALRARVGNVE